MSLPLQMAVEISRVLRHYRCRDFFLNELTVGGATVGAFVLTPDFRLPEEAKQRIREIVLEHGKPLSAKVRFFSRDDAALEGWQP